jgi:signal transduction histidine kinase
MNLPQVVFAIGESMMFYSALRDLSTFIPLSIGNFTLMFPPFTGSHFMRIGIIASLLCQAAAIFMATVKEMEKTRAENIELDSLSRMKTEFLANLSHEIKTPLTVILGDAQRIEREIRKQGIANERIDQSINRTHDEIMRMARLTERAIKLTALQEEKMNALKTTSLFTAAAEGYRSIIEKTGNTLKIQTEENLPKIYGSADQLIGVLLNLLTNANKHTKNGEIKIKIKSDGRFVIISVKDNGAGIPPEILPQIFTRGISGSDSTGMGLAICKNIIESHGGVISIKSENKGTTATFTVPIYIGNDGEESV